MAAAPRTTGKVEIGATAKFEHHRFSQRAVPVVDYSKAIDYNQKNENISDLMDHVAHANKFAEELNHISELEEGIREADYYVNVMYTYRSYSKPLPMIPADLEDTEKKELYRKVFDLLTPQINKIKGLMEFHDRMCKQFSKNLRLLGTPLDKKEAIWRDQMRCLNLLCDKFVVLDALKDLKGQMKNDFARYKRAFSFTRAILPNSGDLMAEITAIYNFLNDPMHPYHVILHHLKEDVKTLPKKEELFALLSNQALSDLKGHNYVTPAEKHGLYRCMLVHLYLVDTEDCNVFKSKSMPIKDMRTELKRLPLLPLYMDTHTEVPTFLSMCKNWTADMTRLWKSSKHAATYNLVNWRIRIQEEYTKYTADYVILLHELKAVPKGELVAHELSERCYQIIYSGLVKLGEWTSKVKEQCVFKAANPIDEARYTSLGGKGGDYQVYEQVTRFNFENDLKYAMVEIIGLIKGLANLLLENEAIFRPVIASYVHGELQQFVQNGLRMPLFRAYKKKKSDLQEYLLNLRLVIADCMDIAVMREDFKQSKEKNLRKLEPLRWPTREVFPTRTQNLLIRRITWHVASDENPNMKGGLFRDTDLKKDEAKEFFRIFNMLFEVPYLANFTQTVRDCSDLSDMWYREFYLNMTGCIQFPIAMSIPWMLTDFAMNTPSLAPNVFFPLSIYNDCAETALAQFHQQHLFDEIEAEVNLVFDQLIFTLYRKMFDYYKNKAASILLDKPFERRMEAVRDKLGSQMKLNYARYQPIFQQKCMHILGRTIDVPSLLTEQLNIHIRENLDAIITRYESSTITAVIEIKSLMDTLELTVEMLRQDLPGIDQFEDMFKEMNEDTTIGSFRGRLFLATYNQLFTSLLRDYIFNMQTRRFVSLNRMKGSKRVENAFLWGSRFTQVYQQIFKVTRGFFGIEHLHAIVQLMGIESMPLLVDELVKTVAHVIIRDIAPYVTEILNSLDPMKQQPAHYGVLGVYGYFDIRLQFVKSYGALREGVFTLLREAGNALCLVQLLDDVLTHESYYSHQIQAFYVGQTPAAMPDESKTPETKFSTAAAKSRRPKESPFIRILKSTMEAIKGDAKMSTVLGKELVLFHSCIATALRRSYYLKQQGGWLFTATLDYLYKLLEDTNLMNEWGGPEPKNGILEHENPKDFSRFWSVATWIFLCPDFTPEEEAQQREDGYVSDRAYFGDGWLWAGITILYLTGLTDRYKLLDPTIYLDKLQRLYPADLTPLTKKQIKKLKERFDPTTEGYKSFVSGLLAGWHEMEKNVELITTVLRSHYHTLQTPITRFTPKWIELD